MQHSPNLKHGIDSCKLHQAPTEHDYAGKLLSVTEGEWHDMRAVSVKVRADASGVVLRHLLQHAHAYGSLVIALSGCKATHERNTTTAGIPQVT